MADEKQYRVDLKPGLTRDFIVQQIEELWHNIYRMHGYIEVEKGVVGDERPGVLKNADALLKSSFARVESLLTDTRLLEKPLGEKPPGV
jgi:hypothetical protein